MSLPTRFGTGVSVIALLAATAFSLFVTSATLAVSPPALLVEYNFENVDPNQGVSIPAPPSFEDQALVNSSDLSIVQGSGVFLLNATDRDGVVPGNQMSFQQGIPGFSSVEPWEYNSFQFDISAVGGPLQITSITFSTGHDNADNPATHDGIIEYWRDGNFLGSDTFNIIFDLSGRPVGIAPADLILMEQPTTFKIRFNQKVYGLNSGYTQLRIDDVGVYGVPVTIPQLYSPNGGEFVRSGSTYAIKWGAPVEAVRFDLKYSTDNGATWITIGSGLPYTPYPWIVPTPKNNQTKCLLKVIGYDRSDSKLGADTSDAPFTIEVIRLDSPNGGATYISKEFRLIAWTTNVTKNPVEKVILYYTVNDGSTWVKIGTLSGNPGIVFWELPEVTKSNTKCKVKVMLKNKNGDTIGSDVSNSYFTITPIP
jgi:hypothetical protein